MPVPRREVPVPRGEVPVHAGEVPVPRREVPVPALSRHATAGPVPVGDAGIAEYEPALPGDLPDPQPQLFFGDDDQWGYGRATEWRTVSGGYASTTGAADVWTRVGFRRRRAARWTGWPGSRSWPTPPTASARR